MFGAMQPTDKTGSTEDARPEQEGWLRAIDPVKAGMYHKTKMLIICDQPIKDFSELVAGTADTTEPRTNGPE